MGKNTFGIDFVKARDKIGKNSAQVARDLNLSPSTIGKWIKGSAFPSAELWDAIKFHVGIDPRDYKEYPSPSQSSNTTASGHSQAVTSQDSQVTINSSYTASIERGQHQGGFLVELNPQEHELYRLFKKYGNPALMEKCLGQLRKAQEIFG